MVRGREVRGFNYDIAMRASDTFAAPGLPNRRSDGWARLIVKGGKVKITTRNSPSAHNSRETCASYQSASARDPHRLVREWTCFDKAHCCLTRIYHISAAAAPAAVYCWTG